jgi:hypothetical protein
MVTGRLCPGQYRNVGPGLSEAGLSALWYSLSAGLWELTAKEIYEYLEGLQESFDTKVRSRGPICRWSAHCPSTEG